MTTRLSKTILVSVCAGGSALFLSNFGDVNKPQTNLLSRLKVNCATADAFIKTKKIVNEKDAGWDWNWDKRNHQSLTDVSKSERTKKHYIFVRHGEYNLKGYNDEEKYLTKLGQEQADMTGQWLSSLDLNYTKIVQSTMTRAKETCGIISKYLPDVEVETTDLLREGAPIQPDPPNRANEPELKYFSDSQRIESAFRKFVYRPKLSDSDEPVEVYVCHANVIRYFLCRVAQFPPRGWLRISLRHGSVTWVTVYSDGDVWIRSIGDAGFMPPYKLSR
ncbi:serine/threonine-protein phosphatase PGAM5, mitochondrial-like [Styela clava]